MSRANRLSLVQGLMWVILLFEVIKVEQFPHTNPPVRAPRRVSGKQTLAGFPFGFLARCFVFSTSLNIFGALFLAPPSKGGRDHRRRSGSSRKSVPLDSRCSRSWTVSGVFTRAAAGCWIRRWRCPDLRAGGFVMLRMNPWRFGMFCSKSMLLYVCLFLLALGKLWKRVQQVKTLTSQKFESRIRRGRACLEPGWGTECS